MIATVMKRARAIAFSLVCLAGSGLVPQVQADTLPKGCKPSDIPQVLDCMEALATFIEDHFPYHDDSGKPYVGLLSSDWCFQVQTDPNVKWWTFKYLDSGNRYSVTPHQNSQATRLRLLFSQGTVQNPATRFGFASIFLALDFNDQVPYGFPPIVTVVAENSKRREGEPFLPFELKPDVARLVLAGLTSPSPGFGTVLFPNPADTKCMTFMEFLRVVFMGRMTIDFSAYCPPKNAAAPSGSDDDCGKAPDLPDPYGDQQDRRQSALASQEDRSPMFWDFNGWPHRIAGAYRFYVHVYQTDAAGNVAVNPSSHQPLPPTPAFLTIGFGGNSGPG